jgi:arsenite methyltransferase
MTEVLGPSGVNVDALRASVQAEYAAVATDPERGFHFHTGARLAAILGYRANWIENLPPAAVASMAGTGNPFALGDIRAGEYVVDCGSGAGVDALIAASLVGPTGRVIGVDMTPEMLAKARQSASDAGLANVEFREGVLERLPVETDWADVVISNGVLNLVPDKGAALAEMHRVLRVGGRLQITDIVLDRSVSAASKQDVSLWTGCIAGGLLADELVELVGDAGFLDIEVIPGGDVFADAPQHSNAAAYGTQGVGIWAKRDHESLRSSPGTLLKTRRD